MILKSRIKWRISNSKLIIYLYFLELDLESKAKQKNKK